VPGTKLNVNPSTTDENPVLRDPEVRLMLRAKGGDQTAFTRLVANYQDRLVGVFAHMLQSKDAAEDLAQEVFLRVYRARHGYEPTAKFSTWIFRIANNVAKNIRRNSSKRKEVVLNPSESGPLGPRPGEKLLAEKSALMPTRQFDKTDMQTVVQEAIAGLNDSQRMAVLLHKFEEMSYADIGASMDLSTSAVKSLLARARENLRATLEPYVKQGKLNVDTPSDESTD